MGLFSRWFKSRNKEADNEHSLEHAITDRKDNRTIKYDARLVEHLKHDHGDIVAAYMQLAEDAQAGRFNKIQDGLTAFKTKLNAHLLTENVRFYVYLEQSLVNDEHNLMIMRDFRREMNSIAKGAVDFVKTFQLSPVNQYNRDEFLQAHAAVGALLARRIELEESSLYPLYQPSTD